MLVKMNITKVQLQKNTINTYRMNNLWLDSPHILSKRMIQVGWIKQVNPNFTSLVTLATNIVTILLKVADSNVISRAQFRKITDHTII